MLEYEIHIRVSRETLKQIDELAKSLGLNRSQVIRMAIKLFLKNNDLLSLMGVLHE